MESPEIQKKVQENEERLVFMERLLEQLNGIVREHALEIDRLTRVTRELTDAVRATNAGTNTSDTSAGEIAEGYAPPDAPSGAPPDASSGDYDA